LTSPKGWPRQDGHMLLMRHLDRWAQASQQAARRNAMVAATDALRRRVEREEAEAYVAAAAARRGPAVRDQPVAASR
jgi:hypothetical protein